MEARATMLPAFRWGLGLRGVWESICQLGVPEDVVGCVRFLWNNLG